MNNTDPSGEWAWDVAFAVAGAAIEAYDQYSETGSVSDWGAVGEAAFDATTIGTAVNTISAVASGEQSVGGALLEAAASKVGGKFLKKFGCCFVAGTQVLTKDGLKNIEDIKVGDLVQSKHEETGEQALKPVLELVRRNDRIIWELLVETEAGDRELFRTTDDHPWWSTGGGWVRTDLLDIGEQIATNDGEVVTVVSVGSTGKVEPTFNFEVADFHTYFVGEANVWVHNANCGSGGPKTGRGKNHLAPDQNADGPHSTFRTNADGKVTTHAEWQPNPRNPSGFDQAKRVDTQHANPHSHKGANGQDVPTPHVHEQGQKSARPARKDEIPK